MAKLAFHPTLKSTKLALASLALVASSLIPSATHATSLVNKTWSFGEARWLGNKYATLLEPECHRDIDCEHAIYQRYKESGTEDEAGAAAFNTNPFVIANLDPYRGRFSYYFNDLSSALESRDYERSEPFYSAKVFSIAFTFSDSPKQYMMQFSAIRGRQLINYAIPTAEIPPNNHIVKMDVQLITYGNDFEETNHIYYTNIFEGCLNDENFVQGMMCETYFDPVFGQQSRAVYPEAMQLEYEPDPEPELTPSLPESNNGEPTTSPNPDTSSSQPSDQISDSASQNNLQLAVANSSSSNNAALLTQSNLPLAPNTSTANLPSLQLGNLNQGITPETISNHVQTLKYSKLVFLAGFTLLLAAANLFAFCKYYAKKLAKSPKKSRKTVDISRKVR